MIRWFLNRQARAFGRRYDYDTAYMHDVINAAPKAGMRMAAFPYATGFRGPPEAGEVVAGAMLASTLDGDCGPCAQLVVDMVTQAGGDPGKLRLCAEGMDAEAGDVGMGFRFAKAAISGDPLADDLRAEIEARFGKEAVIAAAFAAATGRWYPVFKRGLGHGAACTRLRFGDRSVNVLTVS
ncbi:hypothetical protein [Hyphomonas johnsonii]|uniref:Uncharacterized protein n=1 Tax=Hyphomonas johnsonii MHS-2 TaxID=1280950 RepID=A0A059FJC4_9PROT|nr:hypothetical protein [Hyphomonas johnsonii]KCZ90717.1 hypothetical protein HJO_12736 [Hyphomonas johnsonii MHS-2]